MTKRTHLKKSEVTRIRSLFKQGMKQKDIAKEMGRSGGTISRICKNARTRRPVESEKEVAPSADWRKKYLDAVALLAENGLV